METKADLLASTKAEAIACTRCLLHQGRTQVVFGEGPLDADIMLVGEAPGEQEDLQGQPFVGRAGILLGKLLTKVGLSRDEVYITNTVKCRPTHNRDPHPEEMRACAPYLDAQIRAVAPKVLVALGRYSSNLLTRQYGLSMAALRSLEWTRRTGGVTCWVVPTYHPAWLLRQTGAAAVPAYQAVISDLRGALAKVGVAVPVEIEEDPIVL